MSDRVKDVEARIFGDVFRCEEHGGHCYAGWLNDDGSVQHLPYLGWTCGGCHRSSGTDGQPLMFSDHRCGSGAWFGAVMPAVLLAVAAFIVTSLLVAR